MAETPWLHGVISKEDADELLKGQPDGTFLIRERAGASDHILSVNFRGMTTHHLLTKNNSGHFIINNQDYGTKASTFPELVSKLRGKVKKWPVPLQEGIAPNEPAIDPVQDFPYYHGLITKSQAEELLAGDLVDGVYLFRQFKPDNMREFVLGVVYQGKPTHHHAKLQAGTFFVNGTRLPDCTSLQQIVDQLSTTHSFWPVPLLRGIAPTMKRAVATEPEDQDSTWYHGYITKDVAEDRLRSIGFQDGHFLVRARSDAADNNCYIISVVFRGVPTHHLVEPGDGLLKVNGRTEPAASVEELVLLFREAQKTWPVPLTRHAPGLSALPAVLSKTLPGADAPEAPRVTGVASVPEPETAEGAAEAPSGTPGGTRPERVQAVESGEVPAETEQTSGEPTVLRPMDAQGEGSATAAERPVKNDITPLEQEGEAPDEGLVKKIRDGLLMPAEVDAEIDKIKPQLPYPNLDLNEETVEPWLTMHYHGAIGADKAEEILGKKKNVDGCFLLRDLAPSGSSPKSAHCLLTLSLIHDGRVHHVKLSQQDEHGVFFFDDKATGERTLSDAIRYLSERQAGWATPLSDGIPGIKVMSEAEKKRQHEANQAAVKEAEARKQALRDEKLRAQARERGEKTRQKQREEIAQMQSEEARFKQERMVIRQEQIERRREQLRQQLIEERKKKALEEKRRRRLEAARRGNNAEPVIELPLTSDEEDSDDDEEVKEWRRRASARDYGFSAAQRPMRAGHVDTIQEDEQEEVSGFGGRRRSSRRRSSRRSQGDSTDPEKCSLM